MGQNTLINTNNTNHLLLYQDFLGHRFLLLIGSQEFSFNIQSRRLEKNKNKK